MSPKISYKRLLSVFQIYYLTLKSAIYVRMLGSNETTYSILLKLDLSYDPKHEPISNVIYSSI